MGQYDPTEFFYTYPGRAMWWQYSEWHEAFVHAIPDDFGNLTPIDPLKYRHHVRSNPH